MTETEFEALERGSRVRWCGAPPEVDGTVVAVSWMSVLVEWDDRTGVSYRTWERTLLAGAPLKDQVAS